jgi:hypothetical protein
MVKNARKAAFGPKLRHDVCGDGVTWRRVFAVSGGDEVDVEQSLGGSMSRLRCLVRVLRTYASADSGMKTMAGLATARQEARYVTDYSPDLGKLDSERTGTTSGSVP